MKSLFLAAMLAIATFASHAEEKKPAAPPAGPESLEFKISGLFCEAREDDLRAALKENATVTIAKVSYRDATATLVYEPAKLPLADLSKLLKPAGFEIKKQFATIPIAGMDCKSCSQAVYNIVMKIDGVEQASSSFKEGVATAWFDPGKTSRAAIVAALRKAEVSLPEPAPVKK